MKNLEDILEKLVNIPIDFYEKGTVSFYDLVQESGYWDVSSEISEVVIYNKLLNCPHVADSWIRWSEDKRTNEGWSCSSNDKSEYVVSYLSPEKEYVYGKYKDKLEACAIYIKHEVSNDTYGE